jgi:hypothetical protein
MRKVEESSNRGKGKERKKKMERKQKRGRGRHKYDSSAHITFKDSQHDNISMQVASPRTHKARNKEKKMGGGRS